MLDKQLCKWIHKKEITVGDILDRITRITCGLLTVAMVCFMVGFIFYDYLELSIDGTYYFIWIILIGLLAILLFSSLLFIFLHVLDKIINYKVASCPNEIAKEDEKEKLQRK